MKTPQIVIGVVAALALAGGGFAAGMTMAKAQAASPGTSATSTATGRGAAAGRQGAAGASGAAAARDALAGRVLAVSDGSITIAAIDRGQGQQAAAGASPATISQIVLVGASTRIVRTTETDVKLGEIKVNDQVTVVGTTDSAGLVSATAVVVGSTNVLGQLFGSQTGNPAGFGAHPEASPSPTKAP
jgi:hypothetical protein